MTPTFRTAHERMQNHSRLKRELHKTKPDVRTLSKLNKSLVSHCWNIASAVPKSLLDSESMLDMPDCRSKGHIEEMRNGLHIAAYVTALLRKCTQSGPEESSKETPCTPMPTQLQVSPRSAYRLEHPEGMTSKRTRTDMVTDGLSHGIT